PVAVEIDDANREPAAAETHVMSRFLVSKGLTGEMALACSESAAVTLAQILMSEPTDATRAFDPGIRDAYFELLRQVLGQVSTALKPVAGGEVEIVDSSRENPPWPAVSRFYLRISGEKTPAIMVFVALSEQLCKGANATGSGRSAPAGMAPAAPGAH